MDISNSSTEGNESLASEKKPQKAKEIKDFSICIDELPNPGGIAGLVSNKKIQAISFVGIATIGILANIVYSASLFGLYLVGLSIITGLSSIIINRYKYQIFSNLAIKRAAFVEQRRYDLIRKAISYINTKYNINISAEDIIEASKRVLRKEKKINQCKYSESILLSLILCKYRDLNFNPDEFPLDEIDNHLDIIDAVKEDRKEFIKKFSQNELEDFQIAYKLASPRTSNSINHPNIQTAKREICVKFNIERLFILFKLNGLDFIVKNPDSLVI